MERKDFIRFIGLSTLASTGIFSLKAFSKEMGQRKGSSAKMPVLFIGHGSPMNTIEENDFTRALQKLGSEIDPKPKAILCISAHWLTKGTYVHAASSPKMIYDMYGFPEELYKFKYPAPGAPELAQEVQGIIKKTEVGLDYEWGFDHGNYSIMHSLFPEANIPVFQLSIDYHRPMSYHFELAQELAELRRKGVLVIGSGNITHNLGNIDFRNENATPEDWALEFDSKIKQFLNSSDHDSLINYDKLGKTAKLAHPEPSHYLPLIYTSALQDKNDIVSYPYEKIIYGTLSMRCVKFS